MKRSIFSGLAVLSLCTLALSAPLAAFEVPSGDFPDSSGIRTQILDSWLSAELDAIRPLKAAVFADRLGYRFDVSQKKYADAGLVAITVSPQEKRGNEGAWILWRRLSDGFPDHISVYPVQDENIRVDLRPENAGNPEKGRSYLDLIIYGAFAIRNVPVGLAFTSLYVEPFSGIVALTSRTVPWDLIDPDLLSYDDIRSAAAKIREKLGTLVYLDDGVFNEKGEPVLIADGSPQNPALVWAALTPLQNPANVTGGVNCSGFAKWIVDGIVRLRAGAGLFVEPLKTQTMSPETHFTEPFRESRDLFFALDWTRNLASAAVSLDVRKTVLPDRSGVDVMSEPFSGTCVHEMNVGYRTGEILPLLYWLAAKEPGHFYLGALSRERGVPLLRQYHHVAAFFPYFDAEGKFAVAVFESAAETPVQVFLDRNADSFINLVRIRVPEGAYFEP